MLAVAVLYNFVRIADLLGQFIGQVRRDTALYREPLPPPLRPGREGPRKYGNTQVNARDEVAWRREQGLSAQRASHYDAIHMPNNTGIAIIIGGLTFVLGFALTWRIWWLSLVSLLAIIVMMIYRSAKGDPGHVIPAEEMERMDREAERAMSRADLPRHSGGVLGGAIAYDSGAAGEGSANLRGAPNHRP